MARHINPDNLKNLALDAVVKNYARVVRRIFTMEENSPEWIIEEFEVLDSEGEDLKWHLFSVKLNLEGLKKSTPEESHFKNHLTGAYEEIRNGLEEIVDTVCNRWNTSAVRLVQQVSNTSNEPTYILEICNRLHDVVKSALDFIGDEEYKTVELDCDHASSSVGERSLNPGRKLCIDILKTLESIMNIISDIPNKLLVYSQSQPHVICNNLHWVIKNTIPPLVADKLTQRLIEYVQNMFKERSNLYSFCLKSECRRKVLSDLITAVIHPAVTTMDLRSTHNMVYYVICDDMSHFSNIVVLKLSRLREDPDFDPHHYYNGKCIDQMIASGLQTMKNLQIFHYYDCTNDVLAALARNCKRLRCLNVKWSNALNDDCVKSFAELRYLEEVNVIGTNICESLASIINVMDQSEVTVSENKSTKSSLLLENFTCYITLKSQVPLIVSKLQNIRRLKLLFLGETCNLSGIKSLQFLKSLSLGNCDFVDVKEEILIEKGRKLLELMLKNVRNVNLGVLSVNCPELTKLSLKFCSFNPSQFDNVLFPELKHLCLYDTTARIFSEVMCGCPKLTTVKLRCCDLVDIDRILQRNSLEYLEEMVLFIGRLSLQHLRQLISQCGKLRKFTNRYATDIWQISDDEYTRTLNELLEELDAKYIGLSMKCENTRSWD